MWAAQGTKRMNDSTRGWDKTSFFKRERKRRLSVRIKINNEGLRWSWSRFIVEVVRN